MHVDKMMQRLESKREQQKLYILAILGGGHENYGESCKEDGKG